VRREIGLMLAIGLNRASPPELGILSRGMYNESIRFSSVQPVFIRVPLPPTAGLTDQEGR